MDGQALWSETEGSLLWPRVFGGISGVLKEAEIQQGGAPSSIAEAYISNQRH